MNIGNNIKELRKAKGYKQKDLAEKIQIATNSLSRYETGEREPSIETLEKIADALEVPVSKLIMRDITFPVPDPDAPLVSPEGLKTGLESVRKNLSALSETVAECYGEETLIQNYNKLNTKGKQKAIEYVTDLSEQEKYTVPDDVE